MTTAEPQNSNGTTAAAPAAMMTAPIHDTDEPSRAIGVFASEANFVAGQRIAQALSKSSLIPEAYRGHLPNVLIAMELANRIGVSVFMVMQNLDVIHGRPGWRAQFLIATVNASGRFTPLRFRFQGKEGTDEWGCRAVAKERGSVEECIGTLITIKMAKDEGWYARNGSKWRTMPEQMLLYRAASFWTRVYAPELALGMSTDQEIVDTIGVTVADVPRGIAPGSTQELEAELMGTVPSTPVEIVDQQTGEVTGEAAQTAASKPSASAPETAAPQATIPGTAAKKGRAEPKAEQREPGSDG